MSEIQKCPSCGRSTFACGGACTHEPVPLPLGLLPRWTPGSLAEAVGHEHCGYALQADLVQAVAQAGRGVVDAKAELFGSNECVSLRLWTNLWSAVDRLAAAVEAAENWGKR